MYIYTLIYWSNSKAWSAFITKLWMCSHYFLDHPRTCVLRYCRHLKLGILFHLSAKYVIFSIFLSLVMTKTSCIYAYNKGTDQHVRICADGSSLLLYAAEIVSHSRISNTLISRSCKADYVWLAWWETPI